LNFYIAYSYFLSLNTSAASSFIVAALINNFFNSRTGGSQKMKIGLQMQVFLMR